MRLNNIFNSNEGVVGIVAAFLIIGLIVAVISVIQTVYVPKWMEEKEAEHMEEVTNQFAQLKYAIDTHVASGERGNLDNDIIRNPISIPITLGTKELPYFLSMRAFGSIEIDNTSYNISFDNKTINEVFSTELGTIKYSSLNSYYLDQSFIFENGGVILSQKKGNAILFNPSLFIDVQNEAEITFYIINISTVAKKRIIAGYGTFPIQTELLDFYETPEDSNINNLTNITIQTNYKNAWHSFINASFVRSGLIYNTHYNITTTDHGVNIEFNTDESKSTYKPINLNLKICEIGAQISPGWFEDTKLS